MTLWRRRSGSPGDEDGAALFDFPPNAHVVLDEHGTILDINATAAEMLGLRPTSFLGMPLSTWVAPEHRARLQDHLRRCTNETDPVTAELDVRRASDGRVVPVELVSAARRDRNGRAICPTVAFDLTGRRRAETERVASLEKQRAAMSLEAKASVLALLSHELRTPLTPILAAAGELEVSATLAPELLPAVAMIRRNAEHEAHLLDDLLETRSPRRSVPEDPSHAGDALTGTVLLVEDHADSAAMLARMLGRAGYTVRVAHTLRAARELMGPDVDVIVSDLGLPDGSGLDLVSDLLSVKLVPAIALSGYGTAEDVRRSGAAGFSAHLTKPVAYRELVHAIEAARAAG